MLAGCWQQVSWACSVQVAALNRHRRAGPDARATVQEAGPDAEEVRETCRRCRTAATARLRRLSWAARPAEPPEPLQSGEPREAVTAAQAARAPAGAAASRGRALLFGLAAEQAQPPSERRLRLRRRRAGVRALPLGPRRGRRLGARSRVPAAGRRDLACRTKWPRALALPRDSVVSQDRLTAAARRALACDVQGTVACVSQRSAFLPACRRTAPILHDRRKAAPSSTRAAERSAVPRAAFGASTCSGHAESRPRTITTFSLSSPRCTAFLPPCGHGRCGCLLLPPCGCLLPRFYRHAGACYHVSTTMRVLATTFLPPCGCLLPPFHRQCGCLLRGRAARRAARPRRRAPRTPRRRCPTPH
eukprot:gene5882-biopygen205